MNATFLQQTPMALKVANKNAEPMDFLQTLRVYDLKGKGITQTPGTQRARADNAGQWPHQTCGSGDSKDAE